MQNSTLRQILNTVMMITISFAVFMSIIWLALQHAEKIKYDCSIAEISPDIPLEVKEECRNLIRAHNL